MTASTSINGTAETSSDLSRRLGLTSAIMIVIGSMVGSGIFLTPANVAATVQVPGVMMFIWILTRLLTLVFTYVIFAGWIFFALGAVAVFIIRKKMPSANRAFRVPGYPWVPIAFIFVATWFVVNTLIEQTADSLVGLLLLLVGIPFYLDWKQQMNRAALSGKQS
jgi:amino acid transporter